MKADTYYEERLFLVWASDGLARTAGEFGQALGVSPQKARALIKPLLASGIVNDRTGYRQSFSRDYPMLDLGRDRKVVEYSFDLQYVLSRLRVAEAHASRVQALKLEMEGCVS